ncbi:MAG: STT3 domain-containing protein [Candidatus Diapherotrites archaeon]
MVKREKETNKSQKRDEMAIENKGFIFRPTMALNLATVSLVLLILLFGILVSSGLYYLVFFQAIFTGALLIVLMCYFGLDTKAAKILFFIFLLAYTIRCYNVQPGYDYFFEFDSFYHTRMLGYVLKDGAPPQVDSNTYFGLPDEEKVIYFDSRFFWYFSAALYKLFSLGSGYNKVLLIDVVKVLPAFYGAIISVFMFFFAKELFGRKVGFVTAFATATMQAYAYRTMGGFFEDDSMGFLGLVLGFVFFFRALKSGVNKNGVINAILAGFFFAFMGWSWPMYPIIPIILFLSLPFVIILALSTSDKILAKQRLKSVFVHYVLALLIFTGLLLPFRGLSWLEQVFNYIVSAIPLDMEKLTLGFYLGLAFIVLIGLMLVFLLFFAMKESEKRAFFLRILGSVLLLASFIFVLVATVVDPAEFFSKRFVERSVFGSTVGEESPGKHTFGYKYNMQIIFPWTVLALAPIWIFFKRDDWLSPYAFVWISVGLFMAWHKLKFTYSFGLPVALACGVFSSMLFYLFEYLEKNKMIGYKKALLLFFVFLLFGSVAASYYYMLQHPPNIETEPEWKDMLLWMYENTPKEAKIFNWWGSGHWIAFVAERNPFSDNRNIHWEISDGEYARFVTSEDINEALLIIKRYRPDYILLTSDTFDGFASMYIYAYNVHKDNLMTDPRTRPKVQSAFGGCFNCTYENERYNCGAIQLDKNSAAKIPNRWESKPTTTEPQSGALLWYYMDLNNTALCIVGSSINSSMFAKMWFNEPELEKYFELVHVSRGVGILKLYRVKMEQFS